MASPVMVSATSVGRKRKCPQCGHKQAVALPLRTESVPCHRCGASIPPSKTKPQR